MEPTITTSPATPVSSSANPILAHTTLQPLPKYSMPIALLVAAAVPIILLALVIGVMIATNYNILNWME